MKIKKTNILIIFLFLVVILSLGSVAATDDVVNATDNSNVIKTTEFQEISNDTLNQENINNSVMLNDEMSLKIEESSLKDNIRQANYENDSFTALDKLITDNTNGTIILEHDYIMYADEVSIYNDGISINKDITIIGNSYSINANKTGRIFTLESGDVVLSLKNITLKNGNKNDSTDDGGAIYSQSNVNLICEDVCFVNNTATRYGGAIGTDHGSVSINASNFVSFINNVAQYGGAINAGANVSINSNNSVVFIGNIANEYGGAINTCYLDIISNEGNLTFENNIAKYGGAIDVWDTSLNGHINITALNGVVRFTNNTSNNVDNRGYSGGAILDDSGTNDFVIYIKGNEVIFNDNLATGNGGAIDTKGNVFINASSVSFLNNKALQSGGAISTGSVYLANASFINNTASNYGGVIYSEGTVRIVNSTFNNNKAGEEGCVIYNKCGANCTVVNSTFANNSVEGGAVIYNAGNNFTVFNSTFSGNNARNRGGVINNKGNNFTIVNSTFIGNHDMIGVSTVYQNCVLTVLVNNQTIASVKPNMDFNLKVRLIDNQNNSYYSTGLTYQIYNETGLVKEITTDNLFNAITNLTNCGFYNIGANYTDPGHTITTYNVINASVCVTNNTVVLIGQNLIKYYKGDENYNIYLKLNDTPLAGETVAITINGLTNTFVTDNNGLISLPIDLSAGNYKISSVYNGQYGIATLENNITVNSTIVGSETELYYRNGTAYTVCVIDSQGKIVTSGKVRFNINGANYDITINNGTASLPIGLSAGTYVITAENPTNGEKTSNNVTVLPTIKGEELTLFYRNGSAYTVKVVDGQGNSVANQRVGFNINGILYDVVTSFNGVSSLPIGLNAGKYIITAYNYANGESTSNNITVISRLSGEDLELYYKNGSAYTVKVVDGQGNPSINHKLTTNINGVFYDVVTDSNGVATLPIGLNPGKYVITVQDLQTGEMTSNTITVKPILTENQDLELYYKNGSAYTVKALDGQGNSAKNVTVTFNINGVFYDAVTDLNGIASLPIGLNAGNYIITAEYKGFMVSNTITVKPILIGQDISLRYRDGTNYTVQALDGQGKPAVNVTVSLNVNGIIYDVVTDNKGIASLPIGLSVGEYIITAAYNGFMTSNTITVY